MSEQLGERRAGRVVRSGQAAISPLYPISRVVKAGSSPGAAPPDLSGSGAAEPTSAGLAATIADVRRQLEAQRVRLEADLPRAALALARRILDVEFAANPERIVDLARSAVRAARGADRIEVYVHPSQLPALRKAMAALAREAPDASEVRLVPDPSLQPLGLRLETDMGSYFAGLEDRLRRLESQVVEPTARDGGAA